VLTGAIAIWLAQQIQSGKQPDTGDDWLLREDRWQAARRGLGATLQQRQGAQRVSDFWLAMLETLSPLLQQQQVAHIASTIKGMLQRGGGANVQRLYWQNRQPAALALVN
jgi:carboxylate-amine ligase